MTLVPASSKGSSTGGGGSETLITSTTLSSAGVFTFTTIPQTYTDLHVRFVIRSGSANGVDPILVEINGDTNQANYNSQYEFGANGTPTTANLSTNDIYHVCPDASATANRFGYLDVVIAGYTSTLWQKVAKSVFGANSATVTSIFNGSATVLWLNTAAVTQLNFRPSDAPQTFLTGSTARLYGVT